jgi:hypothetical protein
MAALELLQPEDHPVVQRCATLGGRRHQRGPHFVGVTRERPSVAKGERDAVVEFHRE